VDTYQGWIEIRFPIIKVVEAVILGVELKDKKEQEEYRRKFVHVVMVLGFESLQVVISSLIWGKLSFG